MSNDYRSSRRRSNDYRCFRAEPAFSRRDWLLRAGGGFGALALEYLLASGQARAETPATAASSTSESSTPRAPSPLAAKPPFRAAGAKRCIFLFMEGGPSHLDLFDPKPLLNKLAGQPLPDSFGKIITAMGEAEAPLLACPRQWKQHGQSGAWVSEWLPHTAQLVDHLAIIRSCAVDGINHSAGVCQMNTSSILGGRPCLGSWVTYGLGTVNTHLPAFVVMQDGGGQVVNGPRNWSAGFMPAVYQGIRIQGGKEPIPNLNTPDGVVEEQQRGKLDYLRAINSQFARLYPDQTELDARIASYELAFRMQAEAPDAVDLASETEATQKLYGLDQKETAEMGAQCLRARRLIERGVRFVQIYHGAGSKWDAHSKLEENHGKLCRAMDQPVAGLCDLLARGLLDETLVVWGGEFGRTPMSEKGDGRDHNPTGFSMWMAGGGVRGGQVIGSTDELGLRAVEDRMHVHDLHATILYLLGLDHMQLIYHYKGRPERPTLNEGAPNMQLIA